MFKVSYHDQHHFNAVVDYMILTALIKSFRKTMAVLDFVLITLFFQGAINIISKLMMLTAL